MREAYTASPERLASLWRDKVSPHWKGVILRDLASVALAEGIMGDGEKAVAYRMAERLIRQADVDGG